MTAPSDEEMRLNVQAMRDMAKKLSAWAKAEPYGIQRHALYQAAYFQSCSASELEAALAEAQRGKAA